MKQKRIWYIALSLLALLLFATACGSEGEEEEIAEEGVEEEGAVTANDEAEEEPLDTEGAELETEEAAAERVLTDALGNEVTIPAEPERVIASYLEDYLVTLGITPVAQWSVGDGQTVQGYLQDALEGVPTIPHDLPLETVASFEPDLLLMDSAGMVEGTKYAQYSRIAPTYVVGAEQNNDWRQELQEIAKVFGKEEEAQQILDEYEQKVEAVKAQLDTAIGDESVAAIWLVNNTFYIVNDALSSGDVLYNDLGITPPNVVEEISEGSAANWSEISLEKLAELDADHIFLINSDGSGAEALQDDIWQNIPAVEKGNIYEYAAPETSWLYTGPVANTQILEDIQASLIE